MTQIWELNTSSPIHTLHWALPIYYVLINSTSTIILNADIKYVNYLKKKLVKILKIYFYVKMHLSTVTF